MRVLLGVSFAALLSCRQNQRVPASQRASLDRIQVSLPEGWAVQRADAQKLVIGPPGRAVLSVDRQSAPDAGLPSSGWLRRRFEEDLGARVHPVREQDGDGLSLSWFWVHPPGNDGGLAAAFALLGAKRLGDSIYLCASIPGSRPLDVEAAVGVCSSLTTR